ncbi:DUF6461 domain-containing protein [Streptomyces sp. NPDC003362]
MAGGDGWAWATEPRFPLWCLTFTKDLTPAEVLRRYGADPDRAQLLDHARAGDLYVIALRGGTVLRAGALRGWSFCWEDVGGAGSSRGVLAALSAGTETFTLLRGGDGMNRLTHWCDGQHRESFEPGPSDRTPQGDRPFWELVQDYGQATPEQPGLLSALQAISCR